ncbi:DUF427 domain-containing protein [Nocardiopsis sp. CC223A]|uniref:DUF427 domain-containing protein n=1 Tax=Nocardiopsis sp. CC223A TaxID=3044051 RepID=UPI002795AC33|nr:DUF427 domain-containing protein [Nocardiopsis sp. CC223A]
MIRAVWNGVVLAEAERTVMVEGNHYFPPDSLNREHFTDSASRTLCPWKGVARYYDVTVDSRTYPDAAWSYPKPSPLARRIRDHVAFYPGVGIERTREARSLGRDGSPEHGGSAPDVSGRGRLRTLLRGRE